MGGLARPCGSDWKRRIFRFCRVETSESSRAHLYIKIHYGRTTRSIVAVFHFTVQVVSAAAMKRDLDGRDFNDQGKDDVEHELIVLPTGAPTCANLRYAGGQGRVGAAVECHREKGEPVQPARVRAAGPRDCVRFAGGDRVDSGRGRNDTPGVQQPGPPVFADAANRRCPFLRAFPVGQSTQNLPATLHRLAGWKVFVVTMNGMTSERVSSGLAAVKARGEKLDLKPGQRPKSDKRTEDPSGRR